MLKTENTSVTQPVAVRTFFKTPEKPQHGHSSSQSAQRQLGNRSSERLRRKSPRTPDSPKFNWNRTVSSPTQNLAGHGNPLVSSPHPCMETTQPEIRMYIIYRGKRSYSHKSISFVNLTYYFMLLIDFIAL